MKTRGVTCVICKGHFPEFHPYGVKCRPHALCPRCGSLERHRLLWMYLKKKTYFFKAPLKVLEIGPLPILQKKFNALPNVKYISADILPQKAMIWADVTDMPLEAGQFDVVLCYHVLEHVSDDKKALREIWRVLKPGGWALIQSPWDEEREKTLEGKLSMRQEKGRSSCWQSDHVRIYGKDYAARIKEAGFLVRVDGYVRSLSHEAHKKYGLDKDEDIHFCRKPKRLRRAK
jgi:SAM-dependent methyltransferase